MVLRELFIKLGFQVDDEKLKGVQGQLEGIKNMLEAFGAVEVAKGVAEMTAKFGEMAENIHLSAIAAGVTAEAFQKLSFSAKQSGVSQDDLTVATRHLSQMMYEAQTGSKEAALAFQQFGITGEQIKGFKNADDAMHAVSDGVRKMGNSFNAVGPAMLLLGRSSGHMIEWLQKGSGAMKEQEQRASALGAVLSEHQIEALVNVTHAFAALKDVMTSFAGGIAAELAPNVEDAINDFLKFYAANKDIISLEIKNWIWDISFAFGFLTAAVEFLIQKFLNFAKTHEVLVRRAGEFLLVLFAVASAIFVVKKAFDVFMMVAQPMIDVLGFLKNAIVGANEAMAGWLAPIALLVVAIHDLWEVAHGRPGWIQQLIDFLGIGKEVEAVFFGIFDAVNALIGLLKDLFTLNFSKFFSDMKSDASGVVSSIGSIVGFADKLGKGILSTVLPGINLTGPEEKGEKPATPGAPQKPGPAASWATAGSQMKTSLQTFANKVNASAPPAATRAPAAQSQGGFMDFFRGMAKSVSPGGSVHQAVAANAEAGKAANENLAMASQMPSASPVPAGATTNNITNQEGGTQINTTINVTGSPGMNTHDLANKVAETHSEHLDRTLREASRSLRSSYAY